MGFLDDWAKAFAFAIDRTLTGLFASCAAAREAELRLRILAEMAESDANGWLLEAQHLSAHSGMPLVEAYSQVARTHLAERWGPPTADNLDKLQRHYDNLVNL